MPEFSVIIPVYNSEYTLKRCIDSVLNQSYQDFEVLCCYDDCDDGSKEILLEYSSRDARVKIIQGRKKGLSGARNDGIKAACGKYILFLDSDDCFFENAILRIKQEFEKRECDIVVFGTEIESQSSENSDWYKSVLKTPSRFYKRFSKKALFAEKSARPFVWRNAFSSHFLLKNNLFFDEECIVGEDHVFQLCVFPLAMKGISFINDNLYCYTCNRNGSLMDTYNRDVLFKLAGHINMAAKVFDYWKAKTFAQLSQKDLAVWSIYFLSPEITRLPKNQIEMLSANLELLFTNERISNEIIGNLPKCVRNITLAMKNHQTYKPRRIEAFLFLLWWYWHWGCVFTVMKIVGQRCKSFLYKK